MKTNINTKNENTRINSTTRIFILIALSGIITLNVLNAREPEFKEYTGTSVNVEINLTEYRLQLALEKAPEPEMEIEAWMIDIAYWDALINEKTDIAENNDNNITGVETMTYLTDYIISITLKEEPEPEMEIEDWMLDLNGYIQHIHFSKKEYC